MTTSRLLAERSRPDDRDRKGRPVRSVTVNLAESPLGWLFARGHVSRRQFDAGERLRMDWERSQLAPRVTMSWDAAPIARSRGGLLLPIFGPGGLLLRLRLADVGFAAGRGVLAFTIFHGLFLLHKTPRS